LAKWWLSVTFWRRVAQFASFLLLVYGGHLFLSRAGEPAAERGHGSDASSPNASKGAIHWVPGIPPVVDNVYPPSAVCRFAAKGGFFKGCVVYFISDKLTIPTPFILLLPPILIFVALSFVFGRAFCGWVCPLGSLGDFLDALRRRCHAPYRCFSERFRGWLRGTNYFLFFSTAAVSWLVKPQKYRDTAQCWLYLPFCQMCPARLICPTIAGGSTTWVSFANGAAAFFTISSFVLLALFTAGFAVGRRIWCHLCPVGLANSWFNRGAALELRKDGVRCNRCGACADACPMGCTHVRDEKRIEVVNHHDCIFCLKCVERCPKDDCLSIGFFGGKLLKSSRERQVATERRTA